MKKLIALIIIVSFTIYSAADKSTPLVSSYHNASTIAMQKAGV